MRELAANEATRAITIQRGGPIYLEFKLASQPTGSVLVVVSFKRNEHYN